MRADAASDTAGLPRGLLPLVSFDLRRTSIAEGVRAALSTASLVALVQWLDAPFLMVAALAALLTCLADPAGPVRKRLPPVLWFGALGAVLYVGGGALATAPIAVVVAVACALIFGLILVRIFGQAAQQVGNLLTVVLVLGLDHPVGGWRDAAALGGMFWAGSLWAALLTLVIWRIHPYLPARRAIAGAYRALAAQVADLGRLLASGATDEGAWDAHARTQRRAVREAIEQARDIVLATVQARGPVSPRAAQTAIRLEAVEQMFGAVIGLSDLLAARPDPQALAAGRRLLRRLRPVLILLAHGIETDTIERLPRLDRAAAGIAAIGESAPALHAAADAIAERLHAVLTLAAPENWTLGPSADETLPAALRRLAARLRANLDPQSEMLRHAMRAAIAAAPALAVTLIWPSSYGHWLTIMLVLTLQPALALTFARALERVAGTLVGGLAAAALGLVCTTPGAIAVAMFPLAILAFALRPASFTLFMAALTPLIVLLSDLGRPDESALLIAGMRALYVVIGSGLAVVAVRLLWPSWEPGRLGREVRVAVAAHAAYAQAEIGALLGETPVAAVERARRAAGIASNNLEASLHRALLERGGVQEPMLAAALTVDAALRRMAGRISALQLERGKRPDPDGWRAWRTWIGAAAACLATAHFPLPPRPKPPQGDALADALTRIARQMEISAGALARAG